jgi:tetratricopeptide (TPR) repeat protein
MGDRSTAVQLYNSAVMSVNDKTNPKGLNNGYQLFVSACYADPTFWQPFYQCGNNNNDLNLVESAVACFRRGIEAGGANQHETAKLMTNLGWALHRLGQEPEALEWCQKAVDLDASLAYAWMNMSLIHGTLGHSVASVACADKAYALAPDDPVVGMATAFAYLFDGQYAQGIKYFEARYPYKLTNYLLYPYPKWLGEKDKTVFLVADQGLGDTICYSRFVKQAAARAKYIHMCVPTSLLRLFNYAFRELDNVNIMPSAGVHFPQADAWTTFGSLPFALGSTDQEIKDAPAIDLPHYSMHTHWKVPDRALHIGIQWSGSPLNEIDRHRNIPVAQFLDLYRVPGIQLYSLQVGDKALQMHDIGSAPVIQDLSGYITDVVDTLTILREMDLVVCCESALGHIAGLAGKETIIPYSYLGRDYRYGPRGERILWYTKTTMVPQGSDCQWQPCFDTIVKMLHKKIRSKAKAMQQAAE